MLLIIHGRFTEIGWYRTYSYVERIFREKAIEKKRNSMFFIFEVAAGNVGCRDIKFVALPVRSGGGLKTHAQVFQVPRQVP